VLARRGSEAPHQAANIAAIPKTVDLWNVGTLRNGKPSPFRSVTLSAALMKVTIILPRCSDPGQYAVAVTRDQTGNDRLAQSKATASGNGTREEVSVHLDLRRSKPGAYFLSTTHERDQASYSYPLQIRWSVAGHYVENLICSVSVSRRSCSDRSADANRPSVQE
jgi:hypothetical protein